MLRARRSVVTAAIVLALTLTLWLLRWHGLDYPAQLYRVGLVRRQGLGVWDANWYGGHYTPAYGVIVPWLASMVGLATIASPRRWARWSSSSACSSTRVRRTW